MQKTEQYNLMILPFNIVFYQLYSFPTAAITKYHKLALNNMNLLSCNSGKLEVGNYGVSKVLLPLQTLWRESLFVSCWLQVKAGNLWLSLAYNYISPFSPLSSCGLVSLLSSLFYHLLIRTPEVLDEGPTLLQYDLISTNHLCNDLISK